MRLHDFVIENSCLRNVNTYVKKHNVTNYGLEKELEKLIEILYKYKKSNAIIVGKSGIGKTALIELLAEKINAQEVPDFLTKKVIIELSMPSAIAGTRYRGDFEEKMENILLYVENHPNIILFIDEIHTLLHAGGAEGAIAAGEIFKPFLARENISIIGATTTKEYQKTIKKNNALNRRFSLIKMNEPNPITTINILCHVKEKYEKHYQIDLLDREIINTVLSSIKRKGSFPDKAFDALEHYCYTKMLLNEIQYDKSK